MLTHAQIWKGIDRLAQRAGLTPSGLARAAGLDPTTFNPSKRANADGSKSRWPSTESVAKALEATNVTFEDFAELATGGGPGRSVPLIGFTKASVSGYFDDAGFPIGSGWEEVRFPGVDDHHAYALEISGDSLAPVYRDGDRIVIAPDAPPRRGDRVVVKTRAGVVMARELGRVTARTIELLGLTSIQDVQMLESSEIVWMARIVWASQ